MSAAPNAAAGAQPSAIPPIDRSRYIADLRHYTPGRLGQRIRKIVIHNTEGPAVDGAPSGPWLSTTSPPPDNVSIQHLYGHDAAGTRYDIVHRQDTAYHCGDSAGHGISGSHGGIALWNLVSIGHELESAANAAGPHNGYTDGQVWSLAYSVASELITYGLDFDADVVRHADIALPPGRRHDPSSFVWVLFKVRTLAWLHWLQGVPPAELWRYCI